MLEDRDPDFFRPDGRPRSVAGLNWVGKKAPTFKLPGTQPTPMRAADAKRAIRSFLWAGRSEHSAQGATLWVLIEFLTAHGALYELKVWPGTGFELHRLEEPN